MDQCSGKIGTLKLVVKNNGAKCVKNSARFVKFNGPCLKVKDRKIKLLAQLKTGLALLLTELEY